MFCEQVPMYVKALLRPEIDLLEVFNNLEHYKRINVSDEGGKKYVYYYGNMEDGHSVYAYLHPLSEKISTHIGF